MAPSTADTAASLLRRVLGATYRDHNTAASEEMLEALHIHRRFRSLASELADAAEGPLDAADHFASGHEDPLARPAYALASILDFLEDLLPGTERRHVGPLVQLVRWLAEIGDGRAVAALNPYGRCRAQQE